MNESVDTRVVEAKFDSKQFEQGVDKTVKKLDELKKSLNLKDSEKSVADIGEKVQEASEKASSALERLQNRYTEFTGMLKQKLLSGIADEIVGAIMKIKNSFLGLASSLSTGQIGYGMQRYTEMLTSVRTLVSAGETQEASYEVVERLGKYADQTSYSLDQLVSTMAKFKTSGASLSTAQRMVEGLSNAAASMGVNAQDATRAYLNMQQAYSKGAMMHNDWISFESLPMVGTKFNQAILDAAVEAGTLKKEKDGTYTVTSKALKSAGRSTSKKSTRTDTKGITAENMGTKLASRWFNKEVMEKVFGETYYFAEVENDEIQRYKEYEKELKQAVKDGKKTQEEMDKDLDDFFKAETSKRTQSKQDEFKKKQEELDKQLKANKITQQEYNKTLAEYTKELEDFVASNTLTRFGWEAFRAGQEARSFTDVLNTLKDVISRGWAKSFELIFGKLDEASNFFTQLTDSEIANFIYSISEFRNEVLEGWNHTGGRDDLIGILETIDGLIGDIIHAFNFFPDIGATIMKEGFDEEAYNSFLDRGMSDAAEAYKESFTETVSFAEQLGDRLTTITRNVRDKIEKFRTWLNEDVDGETRIQKIVNLIKTAGEIIKNVFSGVSVAVRFAMKLIAKLDPIIQAVLNNIRKIIEPVRALFDTTSNTGRIGGFWGIMETGLNNLLIAITPLTKKDGPLVKLVDFLGGIVTFFAEMAMGTFQSNVQLFSDALGLLIEVFGGQSAQMEQGQGVLAGIQNDIKSFGDTCKEAFRAVGDFFSAIIADIRTLLGLNNETGEAAEDGGLFGNIKKFFNENEFLKQIEYFVTVTVPHKLQELPSVIGTFIESIFYDPKKQGKQDPKGNAVDARTPLKKWLDQAIADTKAFIKTIPTQLKKIPSIISLFIKNLFYERETKKIWVDGKQMEVATGWKKRDFTKGLEEFLQSVVNTVVEFIRNIPSYIGQGISATGTFVRNVISALFGRKDGSEPTNEDVENQLLAPFTNINLENIWNTIKDIGRNIVNQITSLFTGSDDWANNKNWLATSVSNGIKWIKTKADEAWVAVKNWFTDLPNKIKAFFTVSNEGSADGTGAVKSDIQKYAEDIGTKLSELPSIILNIWKSGQELLSGLGSTVWGSIKKALGAEKFDAEYYDWLLNEGQIGEAAQYKRAFEKSGIEKNLESFFGEVIETIKGSITNLPKNLASALSEGASILDTVLQYVNDNWFNDKGEATDSFGKVENNNEFLSALADFGEKIAHLVTETLPTFIKNGLEKVREKAPKWIGSIAGIFGANPEEVEKEVQKGLDAIFNFSIEDAVKSIPGKIENALNDLKNVFKASTFDQTVYDSILGDGRTEGRIKQAESYKRQTQNPIYDFFKNLINSIGDLFQTLGPKVLDGIKKALSWVGEKLTVASDFFKELTEKKTPIEDIFKTDADDKEANPLWESVRSLGETIWSIMTKTIPDFISSAIEYIATQIPNLISKLFGGGSTQGKQNSSELAEAASAAAEEQFIKEMGLDDPTKIHFFDEQIYEDLLNSDKPQNAERYRKYFQKEEDKAVESMASGLGGLTGIFSALADEVDGGQDDSGKKQKGFFANLQEKFGGLIDGITGLVDKVKDNDVLKFIGIGAVIMLLLHELRIIVDNLSMIDDIGYSAKWVGIGAFLTSLSGILGYLAILGGQAEEGSKELDKFNRIKGVLHDFFADIKSILEEIKWIMGFYAGASFFGMLKEFAEDDTPTTKQSTPVSSKKWQQVLGKMGGGLWDTVSSVLSAFPTALGQTAGKTLGISLGGMAIGEMVDQLSGNVNDALGELGNGLETLSQNVENTMGHLEEIHKMAQGENGFSISDAIAMVHDIKDLISSMIELLYYEADIPKELAEFEAKISKGEIADAMTTTGMWDDPETLKAFMTMDEAPKVIGHTIYRIQDLGRIFTSLSGSLALFKNAVSGYGEDAKDAVQAIKDIIGMQDDIGKFGEFTQEKKFLDFKDAFAMLGSIVRLYADSFGDLPEEGSNKKPNISGMVEFLKELFQDDQFKQLIESFKKETMPNVDASALEVAEKVVMFAASLSSIASACKELTGDESSSINHLLEVVKGVTFGTDDQTKISEFVTAMGVLGNGVGSFALETAGLTEDNIKNAERALDMLLRIAVGLDALPSSSWVIELFTGNKQLDRFGQRIENLGVSLNNFFTSIDHVDSNGIGHNYNKSNLQMALSALGSIANFAIALGKIDTGGIGRLETIAPKTEMFKSLAASVMEFISIVTGNNPDFTVPDYTEDDFKYLTDIQKVLDNLTLVMRRIDAMELSNLGDLNDQSEDKNPLVAYARKINKGISAFAQELALNTGHLQTISDYTPRVKEYINVINSMLKSFNYINSKNLDAGKLGDFYDAISTGFFGKYEDVIKITNIHQGEYQTIGGKHTGGLLDSILGFFKQLEETEAEIEAHPKAYELFTQVTNVISEFSRAISNMAIAASTSNVADEYLINYTQYVYNMADALEAIMAKEDIFERFFNFGGKFSGAYLHNSLIMVSTLNQLGQFLATVSQFRQYGEGGITQTSALIDRLSDIDWAAITDVITQKIYYDNQDLFAPTIKPTLELTKEFEEKAAEMRKMLGIDPETGKTTIDAENVPTETRIPTVHSGTPVGFENQNELLAGMMTTAFTSALGTLRIPEPKDYTAEFRVVHEEIGDLNRSVRDMNNAMASMRFVIDGAGMTYAIGPIMDEYLGREGYYVARGNMLQGVD